VGRRPRTRERAPEHRPTPSLPHRRHRHQHARVRLVLPLVLGGREEGAGPGGGVKEGDGAVARDDGERAAAGSVSRPGNTPAGVAAAGAGAGVQVVLGHDAGGGLGQTREVGPRLRRRARRYPPTLS
jgi:hypothetical protein